MTRTKPPFRADHVGSLLRPPQLLQAREEAPQFELSNTDRFGGLLFDKHQLAKSNEYYQKIHPNEAAEVDSRLAAEKAKVEAKAKADAEAKARTAAAKATTLPVAKPTPAPTS